MGRQPSGTPFKNTFKSVGDMWNLISFVDAAISRT